MRSYRALAALLSYPMAEMLAASEEIGKVIDEEALLPEQTRERLAPVLRAFVSADLYDQQERYVGLFDRGRAVSLHLFEHVHGESRNRGQAMVDLRRLYEEHDLEVAAGELPDYPPLFLEFLSLRPAAEAQALLAEPAAILAELANRLERRDDRYAAVMRAVADLAQAPATGASAIPDEDADDLAALDAAWEEAAVRFGPGESPGTCGTDRLRTRLRAAQRDVLPGEERSPQRDTVTAA
ncbi:MAG: nitrate reductase molybdenum cofactor assembly chaperone [Proteobacteria bacterium]|nr:nitrate reductase molybdenum cofactor assembly chaperone [Pseudomonadota bacterium]